MIIDNAIRVDREKAVFMYSASGNFQVFFVNDSELSSSIIRHIIVITTGNYAPPSLGAIPFAGIAELNKYVVTFVNQDDVTIIENMPLLNLLPVIPNTTTAYEELPQFNFKFDPQRSYISTADGSAFTRNAMIFFSFIFKD